MKNSKKSKLSKIKTNDVLQNNCENSKKSKPWERVEHSANVESFENFQDFEQIQEFWRFREKMKNWEVKKITEENAEQKSEGFGVGYYNRIRWWIKRVNCTKKEQDDWT